MSRQTIILTLLSSALTVTIMVSCAPTPPPPPYSRPGVGEYQGWTEQERQEFYHTSIGTQFIPYDWFLALQDWSVALPAERGKPLKDTVEHYGLIRDPAGPKNPDGLPVGMTKTEIADFKTMTKLDPPRVGFNCAFCHTAQFTYQGKSIRIEGGSSMQYNVRFLLAVLKSLGEILKDVPTNENLLGGQKFIGFAEKVLGKKFAEITREDKVKLAGAVKQELDRLLILGRPDPLEWGFGRLDALGRGGNLVFSKLRHDHDNVSKLNYENMRHANAPVSMTQVWGAWDYDWVQWNGSIQHTLARNIGQVIGVGADLFTDPNDHVTPLIDPKDPFRSSVDIKGLGKVEGLLEKLTPPRWPSEFGTITQERAARGKDLYKARCAHCHGVSKQKERTLHGERWHVAMIPLAEIGTDPTMATNFATRTAVTGPLGKGRMYAAPATELLTTGVMKRAGISADGNTWRANLEYMARPHLAVWATPPFLHNNSIPTLYELLSPWEERRRCFEIGPEFEFDPVKVGLNVGDCDLTNPGPNPLISTHAFRFDTGRPGNSNRGHEFRPTVRSAEQTQTVHEFTQEECEALHKGERDGLEKKGLQLQGVIGCALKVDGTKSLDARVKDPKILDERLDVIEYLKTLGQVLVKDEVRP